MLIGLYIVEKRDKPWPGIIYSGDTVVIASTENTYLVAPSVSPSNSTSNNVTVTWLKCSEIDALPPLSDDLSPKRAQWTIEVVSSSEDYGGKAAAIHDGDLVKLHSGINHPSITQRWTLGAPNASDQNELNLMALEMDGPRENFENRTFPIWRISLRKGTSEKKSKDQSPKAKRSKLKREDKAIRMSGVRASRKEKPKDAPFVDISLTFLGMYNKSVLQAVDKDQHGWRLLNNEVKLFKMFKSEAAGGELSSRLFAVQDASGKRFPVAQCPAVTGDLDEVPKRPVRGMNAFTHGLTSVFSTSHFLRSCEGIHFGSRHDNVLPSVTNGFRRRWHHHKKRIPAMGSIAQPGSRI